MNTENKTLRELNVDEVKHDVVALVTGVQVPAISKMQNKRVRDVPIRKLKAYLEAIGGEVNIQITLASGDILTIE